MTRCENIFMFTVQNALLKIVFNLRKALEFENSVDENEESLVL